MIAALAVAHVVLAVILILLSVLTIWSFPLFLIGPVWAILLARRMWRRDPTVVRSLRRTHYVFLGIDALMIAYGIVMLKAAEESAKRGGGLLGGLGIIPIALGCILAIFSIIVLVCTIGLSSRLSSS